MRMIVLVTLLIWLVVVTSGCVFHFKAKEVELDSQRQRVQKDYIFELDKVVILNGKDRSG